LYQIYNNITNSASHYCSVMRLGEDWSATSWPRRGSKYSDFVFRWLLKLIYWKLLLQQYVQLSLV